MNALASARPGIMNNSFFNTIGAGGHPVNMQPSQAAMQHTRHARRLYIGGVPPGTTERDISEFLLHQITTAISPADARTYMATGNPIINTYIDHAKCFCFVELTTIEMTFACQSFDGVKFHGQPLKIRRPNDYKPELVNEKMLGPIPVMNMAALGIIGTTVTDGPNKVFVGGLPHHLGDDDVKELLRAFGELKAFNLVRDPGSATSKGYAFCEYIDTSNTSQAINGLNGLSIGDKQLTVRVANQPGQKNDGSNLMPPTSMNPLMALPLGGNPLGLPILPGMGLQAAIALKPATKVVVLTNMVTSAEVNDDNEFEDIVEDVRGECSTYGTVLQVLIPRSKEGFPHEVEGHVFVEFLSSSEAARAALALSGRKFADRLVAVDYYDEQKFAERQLI